MAVTVEMQKIVDYDAVPDVAIEVKQFRAELKTTGRRTGCPLGPHGANGQSTNLDSHLSGPLQYASFELVFISEPIHPIRDAAQVCGQLLPELFEANAVALQMGRISDSVSTVGSTSWDEGVPRGPGGPPHQAAGIETPASGRGRRKRLPHQCKHARLPASRALGYNRKP